MAKQRSADPLLIEIERGLMPDQFVRYYEMSHFVQDLHRVEEKLAALATAGEPKRTA